jgi:hypothetical protein
MIEYLLGIIIGVVITCMAVIVKQFVGLAAQKSIKEELDAERRRNGGL